MAFLNHFGLCGTAKSYYQGVRTWARSGRSKRKQCRSCYSFQQINNDYFCNLFYWKKRKLPHKGYEKACERWIPKSQGARCSTK